MRWDWKAVLGIAVSLGLVWWVLRDVDPLEVWQEVQGANWWLLIAAVAVATSGFATRAIRWKLLLHPIRAGTTFGNRFAATNIGFAANNLLPARIGEFARAWSISRLESVTVTGAVGSLVVERFLDAIGILFFFGLAVLHPSFPSGATVAGRPVGALAVGIVTIVLTIGLALVVLLLFPQTCLRFLHRLAPVMPERAHTLLIELTEAFLEGLASLKDPRLLIAGILWSLLIWGWNGVSFLLAMWAFDIDQGYTTALFVQAVVALGVSIPSAPGYFGTWHAAALVALSDVFGVAEQTTLAFAFGYHLGGFFPVTFLGMWYATRLGFSLSDLGHAEEIVESELHEEHEAHEQGGSPADRTKREPDDPSAP